MHDFRAPDAHNNDGAGYSDWVLQVTVKNGDDERLSGRRVAEIAHDYRLYLCEATEMLHVTVKNLSREKALSFLPTYVGDKGDEEDMGEITLQSGEVCGEERKKGQAAGMQTARASV